jgi:hypothetical protein
MSLPVMHLLCDWFSVAVRFLFFCLGSGVLPLDERMSLNMDWCFGGFSVQPESPGIEVCLPSPGVDVALIVVHSEYQRDREPSREPKKMQKKRSVPRK